MRKNEDLMPISKFIKILLIVILFLGAIYLLTEKVVKKDTTADDSAKTTYNEIIVGNSLNQKETKYYVLFYDPTSNIAGYLDNWQTTYIEAKETIKLYYVDLGKALNKSFVVNDNSNPNATTSAELKVKNGTLIVVENNKITSYVESLQEINQLLN